jgi:hypothetical protein
MTEIIEVWANTGEILERDRTPEEQAQYEIDQAATKAATAAADKQAKANAKATEDAITHAKSLGFTDAMIAVMYPNLGA